MVPKGKNVFYNDRGFPDQSHDFDVLLHKTAGGTVLCKHKHPVPTLNDINPRFALTYCKATHGARLWTELDLSHLNCTVHDQVYRLIQRYSSVFDDKGQFVPVKDYQCIINTGTLHPICIKKIHYGLCKIPIMRKCIALLAKLGHICQIHYGKWLFKALLAPKPHQEIVSNIVDLVWRFCVNYILLNQVTPPIAYPIPQCDSAVNMSFGSATYLWLFDAPLGYHQIAVAPDLQAKLAFAGPDATKWTYNVMPFVPIKDPSTFIAFNYDMNATWKDLARSCSLTIDKDLNTNVIVDNI